MTSTGGLVDEEVFATSHCRRRSAPAGLGVVLLLGMWMATGAAAADLPAPADVCEPDAMGDRIDFTIDLASGDVEGQYSYKSREKVRIVVLNKNPFLYNYKITVEAQPVPEPALDYALKNLFPYKITVEAQPVPEPALDYALKNLFPINALFSDQKQASATSGTPPSSSCAAVIGQAKNDTMIDSEDLSLGRKRDALQREQATLAALMTSLDNKAKARNNELKQEHQACDTLVNVAQANYTEIDPTNLAKKANAFKENTRKLSKAIIAHEVRLETLREKIKDSCSTTAINDATRKYANSIATYSKNVTEAQDNAVKAASSVKSLTAIRDSIKQTVQPRAFYWTKTVGDYDKPMIVTVNIKRKKATVKEYADDVFISEKLRFGGRARFSLGVGVAFATLEQPEYESIQSVALDPTGNVITDAAGDPLITRVVGLTDDSSGRVAPMVTFNTRFSESASLSHHLTLGLTTNADNQGRDVEYLVGYSLSIAEERFLVTFGFYNGRVQELQNGFYISQPLPEELGQVPVRKSREWGAAIGISVKFK